MTIKRIIRSRLFAVATGMAAVAALAAPTAAHADGGFSADRLASAGASVLRADVAGTAWHTDPATGTLVVTADSTVSAAAIARIKR
ncbi:S1 family peptidase, partial [Streptomyces sp. NPDC059956]|uniref:S1 family peptidase n=1 Tax=Streptomyces sp. NPDC059956 TaxID=3347015 RepID=UPI00365F7D69